MRPLFLTLFLASLAAAGDPAKPDPDVVRSDLEARAREARGRGARSVRAWATRDPEAVIALGRTLALAARATLVKAAAGAGSPGGARVAWSFAGDPEPEIFQAILHGLLEGGSAAIFAAAPEGLSPPRKKALEELRLRWRVEEELLRLKSPTGPTGHYKGQYKRLRLLGPAVLPILLDITADRARPLPGEGAVGRYRIVHPGAAHFDSQELRILTAYAFGELVPGDDTATRAALSRLYSKYRPRRPFGDGIDDNGFEYAELAPAIAFSLHDLGWRRQALMYIDEIEKGADGQGFMSLAKAWEAGFANIRIGQYERGEFWYERVLRYSANKAIAAYNMACHFSTRARDEPRRRDDYVNRALGYLERAVLQHNYSDWVWMEEDGDLSFIRKQPRYQTILRMLKKKYPARKKGKVGKELKDFVIPPK